MQEKLEEQSTKRGKREMAKKKYRKYVKKLSFKDAGAGFFRQIAELNGKSVGVNAQVKFGTYVAAGKVGEAPYRPHKHPFDQVLLWLGLNGVSSILPAAAYVPYLTWAFTPSDFPFTSAICLKNPGPSALKESLFTYFPYFFLAISLFASLR